MARSVRRSRSVGGVASPPAAHESRIDSFLPRHPRSRAHRMSFGPLVSASWLAEHIDDPDVRLVDFRWYLAGRRGADEFAKGHIPGAVFVELDDVTGEGPGRHPLPTRSQFEAAMRRAGVDDTSKVVVYDDTGGSVAARLWFLLGWFGHADQA